MNNNSSIELKNVDMEDISDVLRKVEKSFGFKFGDTELKDIKTFGELSDIVGGKVQGDNSSDCTTQQAFYKLRNAITAAISVNANRLTVETKLKEIFPRHNRRRKIASLENELGFKIKILRPKNWMTGVFLLIFLASLVGLYFSWQAGLSGLVFSIVAYKLADIFGKELDLKTVGQLTQKISREHYLQVRRDPTKINRAEIAKKMKELFIYDLDLEEDVLTRQATIV